MDSVRVCRCKPWTSGANIDDAERSYRGAVRPKKVLRKDQRFGKYGRGNSHFGKSIKVQVGTKSTGCANHSCTGPAKDFEAVSKVHCEIKGV